MINTTLKKTFNFFNKRIPYYGFQLSAIDYGQVLHPKFKIKYTGHLKLFLTDRDRWFFNEIFYSVMLILDGISRLIFDLQKQKKILPWNRKEDSYSLGIKSIILKHPDFFKNVKEKYFKSFPKSKKIVEMVISKINSKKTIVELIKNN